MTVPEAGRDGQPRTVDDVDPGRKADGRPAADRRNLARVDQDDPVWNGCLGGARINRASDQRNLSVGGPDLAAGGHTERDGDKEHRDERR